MGGESDLKETRKYLSVGSKKPKQKEVEGTHLMYSRRAKVQR